LPPHLARSSLGLAYQIEPDPEANRRPVGPPGHARRRCPPPKLVSCGETPPDDLTTAPIGPQATRERRSCRPEPDQPPSAAAQGGRGGFRSPGPGLDEVQPGHGRFSRIKVGVSSAFTAAQPDRSWGPAEATTRPARGSQPDLGAHRTEVRALHPRCAAETTLQPKLRGWPARQPGEQALPASEPTRSARRPGSRAMSTKVAPFQGRRDPACRPPCTGCRSALTRRPHALPAPSREDGCRLPSFTRKEGKRKETPALQPARRRARGGQVPMEQSLGARRSTERRALLRAHAARTPGFEEPPRFYL